MSEKWAVTIKYNPNDMTSSEMKTAYELFKSKWEAVKGLTILHWIYEEQDKKGRHCKLHVHGVISISRGLYRKKLQEKNFHIKMVTYTSNGWDTYMKKNIKLKLFEPTEVTTTLIPTRSMSPNLSDQDNIEIPKRSLFLKNI